MSTGSQANRFRAIKITSLENRLSGVLKPVPPRKEFVRDLSHRIQVGNQASFVNHLAGWHFFAMLIAGLLSVAVLLVVGVRALTTLFRRNRPKAI